VPNTQAREVNLTKRIHAARGLRYCPVVLSPNGRVKPDLVLVKGKPEKHPEGARSSHDVSVKQWDLVLSWSNATARR